MEGYLRAEISASALRHNLGLLRGLLKPLTRLCPVVKANAYGHGLAQVLPVLESAADMVGVATCSEAARLRELGWQRPVLMFTTAAAADVDKLEQLVTSDVTLTLTNPDEIPLLKQASDRAHRPVDVHIKIDSGMTRSGVLPEQAGDLLWAVRASPFIRLRGMYTHFACAEDVDKSITLGQLHRFSTAVERCGGGKGLVLHAANSAACMDLAQTHLDMVRPGMAVYGYQPGPAMRNPLPVRPSLRLVAPIVQIKDTPAGVATGYGLTYYFKTAALLALVPIGYADGYFRAFSNVATMRVRGVDCPVRGRVSMDQTVIEITRVPQARIGDEAEIISTDPASPHSLENLAKLAGTIPYEVITRLGDRITRVLVE